MVLGWRWALRPCGVALMVAGTILVTGPAPAADLPFAGYADDAFDCTRPARPPAPRFFPRADGDSITNGPPAPPIPFTRCTSNLSLVPTDAPDDPSYAGSPYGLGKPSYYGFRPPLGHDDPFGRPIRVRPY